MVILIIGLVAIGIAIIYGFIKGVNAIFNPLIKKVEDKRDRILKKDNPYIAAHRMKIENDKMYDEYLKWLDKAGGDIPFEKWKTQEELNFEKVVNT